MEFEKDCSSRESWESVEDNTSSPQIAAAKCLFIGSEHFNPILALGCNDLKIPISGAPCYRSIVEFDECVPSLEAEGTPPPTFPVSRKQRKVLSRVHGPPARNFPGNKLPESGKPVPALYSSSTTSAQVSSPGPTATTVAEIKTQPVSGEPFYPIPGRRFLPHQLPVAQVQKAKPHVLTLMDECTGPLAALNEARVKSQRIRVWRRDDSGIRGYCSGFVVCFDNHWNLILKDVDEIFQRRRGAGEGGKQKMVSDERKGFKSGEFLSEYSQSSCARGKRKCQGPVTLPPKVQTPPEKSSGVIRRGTPTGHLISGPENAIEVCRIGIRRLMLTGIENEKLKKQSTSTVPPSGIHDSGETPPTKSALRKKQLVILRKPEPDFLGNKVVARTQLYEIVERHLPQIVLMGRSVAFVETNLQSLLSLK